MSHLDCNQIEKNIPLGSIRSLYCRFLKYAMIVPFCSQYMMYRDASIKYFTSVIKNMFVLYYLDMYIILYQYKWRNTIRYTSNRTDKIKDKEN